eukprot:COSAG05_NODE_22012_length_267_cov_2.035714_1_plen_70_part_10
MSRVYIWGVYVEQTKQSVALQGDEMPELSAEETRTLDQKDLFSWLENRQEVSADTSRVCSTSLPLLVSLP